MSALRLDGAPVAARIRARVQEQVSRLTSLQVTAGVAVVLATDNESAAWYVRAIEREAARVGIDCIIHDLGCATTGRIAQRLEELNRNPLVHGIILQTPLLAGVDAADLVGLISPAKDIDGANPLSLGRLSVGMPAFAPATARSVMEILAHYRVPLAGEHVTVVGRSAVVGKPLAQLLLGRDATVTTCHSRSTDLAAHTRPAAVTVVAAGRAGLLTGSHVTEESVVIDVGTNVDAQGNLVGDVAADSVASTARALSPVPGGVGSVTTALLMLHTIEAALSASGVRLEEQREGELMVGQR